MTLLVNLDIFDQSRKNYGYYHPQPSYGYGPPPTTHKPYYRPPKPTYHHHDTYGVPVAGPVTEPFMENFFEPEIVPVTLPPLLKSVESTTIANLNNYLETDVEKDITMALPLQGVLYKIVPNDESEEDFFENPESLIIVQRNPRNVSEVLSSQKISQNETQPTSNSTKHKFEFFHLPDQKVFGFSSFHFDSPKTFSYQTQKSNFTNSFRLQLLQDSSNDLNDYKVFVENAAPQVTNPKTEKDSESQDNQGP